MHYERAPRFPSSKLEGAVSAALRCAGLRSATAALERQPFSDTAENKDGSFAHRGAGGRWGCADCRSDALRALSAE